MSDALDQEFTKAVNQGLVPKMRESAYVASFVPTAEDEIDVKFAVELGVSIMLDKPIFAIVKPGETVPGKLRQVADMICVADLTTDEGQAIIQAGLLAFMESYFPEEEKDDDSSDTRPE